MGIKNLNRYFMDNCTPSSIEKKHLGLFQGKTLVIDTSIYLYKFMGDGQLIEQMYLMISIFLHYKITPIFVFDGKPPKEKDDTIKQRKMDKQQAEEKFNQLQQTLVSEHLSENTKEEIKEEMEKLKKQFVRIRSTDIQAVKKLMDLYGITYIEAVGEADKLCAKMVITKKAWACISDDMDMFVYGCTRVMRHMSLLNHTIVYYNLNSILNELQLPLQDLREIMILSGTDYNLYQKISLHKALKYYKEYRESIKELVSSTNFYHWLGEKHVKNAETLSHIYNMFSVEDMTEEDIPWISVISQKKRPNLNQLKEWLYQYGFVFLQ
jgi:flap endonuclease-1